MFQKGNNSLSTHHWWCLWNWWKTPPKMVRMAVVHVQIQKYTTTTTLFSKFPSFWAMTLRWLSLFDKFNCRYNYKPERMIYIANRQNCVQYQSSTTFGMKKFSLSHFTLSFYEQYARVRPHHILCKLLMTSVIYTTWNFIRRLTSANSNGMVFTLLK